MKIPKISVVIATYKRQELLCRAIDSVLMQDYRDIEVIIVDDNGLGSAEQIGTEKTIRQKYSDESIRYVVNNKGMGGGGARNEGIKASRAEFIAFLDDDEDWLPGKLTKQMKVFSESSNDTGVVDSGFYTITKNDEKIYHSPEMQGWILEELLAKADKRAPKLSTMLCRKSALEQAGLFDPAFKSRQDLDLYIRLSRICRFASIDEPLAYKRYDAGVRISTNVSSKLQGYDLLYRKNIDEYKRWPDVHADYLIKHSAFLLLCGHYLKALKKIIYAFYLVKFNPLKVIKYKKIILSRIYKTKIRNKFL
jgi:glycosyltransferase involved in cell wall biosynthesis